MEQAFECITKGYFRNNGRAVVLDDVYRKEQIKKKKFIRQMNFFN
jgi:hypothetical protein